MEVVHELTWREFQLKKIGWERQEERRLESVRLIAWYAGAYSINAPKRLRKMSDIIKLPKDEIGSEMVISDEVKELFFKRRKEAEQRAAELKEADNG